MFTRKPRVYSSKNLRSTVQKDFCNKICTWRLSLRGTKFRREPGPVLGPGGVNILRTAAIIAENGSRPSSSFRRTPSRPGNCESAMIAAPDQHQRALATVLGEICDFHLRSANVEALLRRLLPWPSTARSAARLAGGTRHSEQYARGETACSCRSAWRPQRRGLQRMAPCDRACSSWSTPGLLELRNLRHLKPLRAGRARCP
jgi:hypothetical protein